MRQPGQRWRWEQPSNKNRKRGAPILRWPLIASLGASSDASNERFLGAESALLASTLIADHPRFPALCGGIWAAPTITTTPSGATILLDGTEVGSTPYHRAAFAGHHQVLVRLGGFRSRQAAFDVESQKAARLQFDLEPGRDMPKPVPQPSLPARQPRPAWRLALGGGLLGIGLAGVGGGAYGISIDGYCIDSANYPEQPVCIGAFFPGLAFTISGAAVALTGALLIAIPGPRTKRQPAASISQAAAGAPSR